MIRRITFYTSMFSLLLACDGTNFSGDSNSSHKGPSSAGDNVGVSDAKNPDGSGDSGGVSPEEAQKRLETYEDQIRRHQEDQNRLETGDGSDNAIGGACPIFAQNASSAQLTRTKITLNDGSSTPEVPDGINLAEIARDCTPSGNDCRFNFAIYSNLEGTKHYQTLPAGQLTTGHRATMYEGRITNYLQASCDVVALTNPTTVNRTLDGCFAADTKIKTDQGEKRIAEVQAGDMIYSPISKTFSPVIYVTVGPEAKALIEVGYQGKKVHVTSEHPFVTASGLKQAQELTKADRLMTAKKGEFAPIEILRQLPVEKNQIVYNVKILGEDFANRIIVADGIVTGDLRMQQELAHDRRSQPNFNQPVAFSTY